jgi:hypothetical protein
MSAAFSGLGMASERLCGILRHIARLAIALLIIPIAADAQQKSSPPIQLHPKNPHYFFFHDRAVALIGSGEHYGAVLNADFDFHKYLATLQAEGMNYTRLFGGSYVEVPAKSFGILRNDLAPASGRFLAPWARSGAPGYAGGGNKFDLEKWNPEYFSRLHDFLAEADRRGIVVEITFFSSQYGDAQWQMSPFNRENNVNSIDAIDWKKLNTLENGKILAYQEKYVRKMVREANTSPNVIFEIANEPWSDRPVLADAVNPYLFSGRDQYPNSVDLPDELTMAWQRRIAEWITQEESTLPNKHLIAQNCCNFRYPVREVLPGVSILNFHYAYPDAALLNYGLDKALSYDETGFLGREDEKYVRQAWNFMLSGGGVFDNLDYSFSVGHEHGNDLESNGPGGGSPNLRRRLRVLSQFLNALPLLDLRPDLTTVEHAGGVVAHLLSSPNGEYAMYVDGNGPTEIVLNLPSGNYQLSWIDVADGNSKGEERFVSAGGGKKVTSPEFRGGIAMHLRRSH